MTQFFHSTTIGDLYRFTGRVAIFMLALSLTVALGLRSNTLSASADVGNTAGTCMPATYGNYGAFQAPDRIRINNPPMVKALNLTPGVDTQTFYYTVFLYFWNGSQWLPVQDQSGSALHGPIYGIKLSEAGLFPGPVSVNSVSASEVKVDIPASGYYFAAADELWVVSNDTGKLVYDSHQQWVSPLTRQDGSTGYYCKF